MFNRNFLGLLLIVSSMLFFVGCSDKETQGDDAAATIVGTWTYESSDLLVLVNSKDIVQYFIEVFQLTEVEAQEFADLFEEGIDEFAGGTFTFNANGSFTVMAGSETSTGTWSVSEDGKTLTVVEDEGTTSLEIKTLTSTHLSLYLNETETDDLDQDGTDDTIQIELTLNLTK